MIIKIKNNDTISHTYCGQEILPGEYFSIPELEEGEWSNNSQLLIDISNGIMIVNNGVSDILDVSEAISFLKNDTPVNIGYLPPFAKPEYRTIYSAAPDVITCPVGETTAIDFQLLDERYVSGGKACIKNAEFGDYIQAGVYDLDGLIPEAYRASLCENWPCINQYIEKSWILVKSSSDNTLFEVDTKPLNAKVPAGFYLRILYTACQTGVSREVVLNYYLTRKI